jgi:hypothetical protein
LSTRERPAHNRYIVAASDRESFKQCRRAWDFSAKVRQNYEPSKPTRAYDFEAAILEALSLYYYPGMWDWNRQIVHPITMQGFARAMRRQRLEYCGDVALSPEEELEWDEQLEVGQHLLKRYMEWAPGVDLFTPIRVELPFKVNIVDPERPEFGMLTPDGAPVQYQGRAHVLVSDGDDSFWAVVHRVSPEWLDPGFLLLDDDGLARCWALQSLILYPIKGVIYNELRRPIAEVPTDPSDGIPEGLSALPRAKKHRFLYRASSRAGIKTIYEARRRAGAESSTGSDGELERPRIEQRGNDLFRRTQVWISQALIEDFGKRLAFEALDMIDPGVRIYPNPTIENCSSCRFAEPCMAMNDGADVSSILEATYRQRPEEESQEGRIGADGFHNETAGSTMRTGRTPVFPRPLGWSLPASRARRQS